MLLCTTEAPSLLGVRKPRAPNGALRLTPDRVPDPVLGDVRKQRTPKGALRRSGGAVDGGCDDGLESTEHQKVH